MSTYYLYYLGYELPDGKIYPLGPFNYAGKYTEVVAKSRSFASDLWENFNQLPEEKMSDELIRALFVSSAYDTNITYEECVEDIKREPLRYLPLSELPSSDFIRDGYFLIDDVSRYLQADEYEKNELIRWELFTDRIPKEVYAAKLQNELLFSGQQSEKKLNSDESDEEDDDCIEVEHSCKDYMYFAFPDYSGKEYEAFQIHEAAAIYESWTLPENAKKVVIEWTC